MNVFRSKKLFRVLRRAMPWARSRVILVDMFGSERPASRMAPHRTVRRLLCGLLLGILACDGGAHAARGEMPSDETPPDEMLPSPSEDDTRLSVSPLGAAFAPLINDALAQPEEAWPYLRYILASSGVAALDNEQERLALLRLVNSTSLSPEIAAPVALAEVVAYRLDLRDYLWDRQVVVGGVIFSDAWEAIVERSGLALPALPDEQLAALTGTATAVLPARAFLAAASSGSVYHALTGAPGFETQLQTRLEARFPDPETEKVYNAGLGEDARHDYQGARRLLLPDGSAYWQGLPDTPRGNSIFVSPLDFNSWETDAIYPLPNGFPAFFLDTPYTQPFGSPAPRTRLGGREVNTADELVADCIACHSNGPLPMEDTFDEYVRDDLAYSGIKVSEFILSRWPSQEGLDAIVTADSAAYERTIERAGLSTDSAAALQAITRRYAGGLGLADMAAALHASETQVRAVLPTGTTTLDVASFLSQFRALLCLIHPDARAASAYCLPTL
jgi:hypothetical protein